jgi:hypothetical protein
MAVASRCPQRFCLAASEKIAKLKEEVQRLHGLKVQILAAQDQQISLTDPDSRSMATSGRGSGVVGYDVQVAVDTEHHLIVAHEVTNVGSDRAQLAHMAKEREAASGRAVATLPEHMGSVSAVAFSPDGRLVLTGSADGTARPWEARPAGPSPPCPSTWAWSRRWRSRPTAGLFSPAPPTARRGCGRRRPARPSPPCPGTRARSGRWRSHPTASWFSPARRQHGAAVARIDRHAGACRDDEINGATLPDAAPT